MRRIAPLVVVAAPPLVAFGLVAVFMAAETLGFRPISAEPANVSEAAARGASAAAIRFIAAGADPNMQWPIAGGVLGTLPRRANAIDAAILGRRQEMISLLLEHGAHTDTERARCLAEAVDFPDALPLLGMPAVNGTQIDPKQVDDPVGACLHDAGTN